MRQIKNSHPILLLLLTVLALVITSCAPVNRQAEIAAKGEQVMPFDLERSTHIFEKQGNGGLQQVLSDDQDADQVALIRSHLAEEAERFQSGDFQDPAAIHGDDMDGLHELVTGADRLTIDYSEIKGGAQIVYSADDAALVTALHAWFDQQVTDHGDHVEGH